MARRPMDPVGGVVDDQDRLDINTNFTELYASVGAADSAITALQSKAIQELTATGAVTAGVEFVELNHATVAIAATIANAANHAGFFVVKNTSASGTAAHTLTLTAGTFDGTNDIATLNAPNEQLLVFFDSAGAGRIVVNTGSVALSAT